MSALKEKIIEELEELPEPALKQVMNYLVSLKRHDAEEEPSLLSIAGALSGKQMSGEEIENELYGPVKSK
ncbi:MAG TPA: DUF2281 domain-containing protein [Verrucomicrobiae bacterium]|jgi:hypothetical protein